MNGGELGQTLPGVLGGYRILERLRAGSMGALYLGRRIGPAEFSRPVAIKVIHDHLVQNERFRRMFIDEARLSARIDHPNVVRVEEFGTAEGRTYLVMELVNGVSLAQAMALLHAFGRIPVEMAVAIAIEVAGGLHGAHEATDDAGVPLGIVHRDVSPQNVLVSYAGSVRVVDFGIAKAREIGGQTNTGSLRGKLAYMPPEQAKSARTVDRRADIYGLGLVLWEMLTSRRVYDAPSEMALFEQIRNPVIVPPSTLAPDIPAALDDVLLRMLALDPEKRPPTALALQRGLGNAVPAALRVFPSDVAALMQKVRANATAIAEGTEEPSGLYGQEVRRTLTILGKHLRLRSDGGYDLKDEAFDTLPQNRGGGARSGEPSSSVIVASDVPAIVEEEATLRNAVPPVQAPQLSVHTPAVPRGPVRTAPLHAATPMDPLPPHRPSLPSQPQPQPQPPSQQRPSQPQLPHAVPPSAREGGLDSKHALFVIIPAAVAALIGIALVVGRNETPPSPPARGSGAGPSSTIASSGIASSGIASSPVAARSSNASPSSSIGWSAATIRSPVASVSPPDPEPPGPEPSTATATASSPPAVIAPRVRQPERDDAGSRPRLPAGLPLSRE